MAISESNAASVLAAQYGLEDIYWRTKIEIDGVEHPALPLDVSEMRVWTSEFDTIIAPLLYKQCVKKLLNQNIVDVQEDQLPTGIVSSILRAKAQHLYAACMIARKKLDLSFTGFYAAPGELGWRHIKPCDIMRTTAATETPNDTWQFTFTANQDNWLGFAANNATTANIDKNICVCGVGLCTPTANFEVEQLRFTIGNITFNPLQLKPIMSLADAPEGVRAIPMKTIMLTPKSTYSALSYSLVAHTCELIVVGVTYGDGKVLTDLTRTTVEL